MNELVQNALKFSEPGSPVRVNAGRFFNAVIFSVSDQGRGFSTEQIRRIGAYMQFDRKITSSKGRGWA